jgi:YidC/Oxa1 family membrane protein insertase
MSTIFVLANVLQPLIEVFEWLLLRIYDVLGSWGWSIVGLTVVVRAALVPLTLKQFRSMRKLQTLAPQIKEVQEKYKDDKQRQQQEMMRFYQENQVNPLSSCLPLVAQFPVFISLFYMLRTDLKLDICPGITSYVKEHNTTIANTNCDQVDPGSGQFLFIPDLTHKATGAVLVILIVLYVGSQVVSTLLMSVTADKTQRRIFLVLPLIFVTFVINFPAGLIVYWITTNLWTIAQGYIVRRQAPPIPAPAAAGAGGGSGGGSSGGGLLAGLLGGGGSKSASSSDGKGSGGSSKSGGSNGKADAGGDGADAKPKAKPPPPPRKKRKTRSGRRR